MVDELVELGLRLDIPEEGDIELQGKKVSFAAFSIEKEREGLIDQLRDLDAADVIVQRELTDDTDILVGDFDPPYEFKFDQSRVEYAKKRGIRVVPIDDLVEMVGDYI